MQPTDKESSAQVINIAVTYESHIKIMPNILAAHGLSGCDTISSYFGIGQKTFVNVLNKKNIALISIGVTAVGLFQKILLNTIGYMY